MLDVNKLICYLNEQIEQTEVEDEFKPENQRRAGANDAFRAVKSLILRSQRYPNKKGSVR